MQRDIDRPAVWRGALGCGTEKPPFLFLGGAVVSFHRAFIQAHAMFVDVSAQASVVCASRGGTSSHFASAVSIVPTSPFPFTFSLPPACFDMSLGVSGARGWTNKKKSRSNRSGLVRSTKGGSTPPGSRFSSGVCTRAQWNKIELQKELNMPRNAAGCSPPNALK